MNLPEKEQQGTGKENTKKKCFSKLFHSKTTHSRLAKHITSNTPAKPGKAKQGKQAGRQASRQAGRQADWQTDRQTEY